MFTSHLLTPSHRIPHRFHDCSFSFVVGDVFMIEDVINQSWLWVTLQRNKERGLVPRTYVEDVVGTCAILYIFYCEDLKNTLKLLSVNTCHAQKNK